MNYSGLARYVALACGVVMVPGCGIFGGSTDTETPGLFAVKPDGKVQRLDGSPEWERKTWAQRSNLDPNMRFLVTGSGLPASLADLKNAIRLTKVVWVRSDVTPQGEIGPTGGPRWVAADLKALEVPVRYVPLRSRRGSVRVEPVRRLEPGLYSLQVRNAPNRMTARIGIQWPSVDQRSYAAAQCVDRYIAANSKASFRPCAEQQVATARKGLRIHLVAPEHRVVDGGAALVVKGVVVNVSETPRPVPVLQAGIRDRSGRTLRRWLFSLPEAVKLPPGESASFETVSRKVPRGTANVFVDFADGGPVYSRTSTDSSGRPCGRDDGCQSAEITRQGLPATR